MMKKITILFILTLPILFLCGCDSKEVRQAKKAYEENDFTRVVDLLSEEENLSQETQDILNDSEVNIAYEEKDYAKVVELLSKEKDLSQESQDMLITSEANILYEKGEYVEAVKKIASSSKGIQHEQYEEMFDAALKDSLDKHSADAVVELLALDESKSDAVYEAVTEPCKNKDYNGFVYLDGLVKKLPDGDLKTKLSDFSKENDVLRAQSFLLGKWKETDDYGPDRTVEVTFSGDNLIGIIVKIEKDSWFKKNDLYWKDFNFIDRKRFTCISIAKEETGATYDSAAVAIINYKKGTMHLHLTPQSDFSLDYYDSHWKRVNK